MIAPRLRWRANQAVTTNLSTQNQGEWRMMRVNISNRSAKRREEFIRLYTIARNQSRERLITDIETIAELASSDPQLGEAWFERFSAMLDDLDAVLQKMEG